MHHDRIMLILKIVCVLGLVGLFGCGEAAKPAASIAPVAPNANLALHMPPDLSSEKAQVAAQSWPKIRQACPGIDVHAADLDFVNIQDGYRLSIVLLVRDQPTSIPRNWVANGHHCFFEIGRDGKSLFIAKQPCKAICLNADLDKRGDLVLPLP